MRIKNCLLILILSIFFHIQGEDLNINNKFNLIADLKVGNEDNDDYVFGELSQLEVNNNNFHIYILDAQNNAIKEFDEDGKYIRKISNKGKGPGEFPEFHLLDIAIDSNENLVVLDKLEDRVCIFNKMGGFVKKFDVIQSTLSVLIDKEDNIVILGANKGKMFHVYNENGYFISSFGELFKLPKLPDEYIKFSKYPLFRVPFEAFYSKKGNEYYVCHTFKYEIWAINNKSSRQIIQRKSKFFIPIYNMTIGGRTLIIRSIFPIFKYKDYLFITIGADAPEDIYVMDIYKNLKYKGYVDVKGHLRAVDKKGRLYFTESDKFVRYNFTFSPNSN